MKNKAFTLTESLVAMVISAIVIGLVLFSMRIINKNIEGIKASISSQSEITLLKNNLQSKFGNYGTALLINNNEVIYSNPIDSTSIRFEESVIRADSDTLLTSGYEVKFYFQGKPIQKGPVDAIKLYPQAVSSDDFIFCFKLNDQQTRLLQYGI